MSPTGTPIVGFAHVPPDTKGRYQELQTSRGVDNASEAGRVLFRLVGEGVTAHGSVELRRELTLAESLA
jgi:hypothetical protein